jgi:hypothetical protein
MSVTAQRWPQRKYGTSRRNLDTRNDPMNSALHRGESRRY